MASNAPRFKVAICGAGIGGLTAAVALSKSQDIDIEIYEGASSLTQLGAGIGLFTRPWEILQKLGLDEELLRTTEMKRVEVPVTAFTYRRADRPEGLPFYTLVTKGNLMMLHRADFQSALLKKLPRSTKITCSKRLRSFTQRPTGPVELHFEDGTTSTCDVLIGSDGLKSAVRGAIFSEKAKTAQSEGKMEEAAEFQASIEPLWSGTQCYRALIPAERLNVRYPGHRVFTEPTQYLGKNGYILAYPISKGKMINFVAFKSRHDLEGTKYSGPWVTASDSSEVTEMFRGWEPEVQALIDCVERPLQWSIHCVNPLSTYFHGRVVLIGDAAHASPPHQGSGAGQAIEDAFVLATVLSHPSTTRETLSRALSIFDRVRRPVAHEVHERNRRNGQYFTLYNTDIDSRDLSSEEMKKELHDIGQAFTKNWEWAWMTSADPVVQEALQLLESE